MDQLIPRRTFLGTEAIRHISMNRAAMNTSSFDESACHEKCDHEQELQNAPIPSPHRNRPKTTITQVSCRQYSRPPHISVVIRRASDRQQIHQPRRQATQRPRLLGTSSARLSNTRSSKLALYAKIGPAAGSAAINATASASKSPNDSTARNSARRYRASACHACPTGGFATH
jgi:hypothetical protein